MSVAGPQKPMPHHEVAGFKDRFLAFMIDFGIVIGFGLTLWTIGLLLDNFKIGEEVTNVIILTLLFLLFVIFYVFILQSTMKGQTLGEFSRNIKSIRLNGTRAKAGYNLRRWLLRPLFLLIVIPGTVLAFVLVALIFLLDKSGVLDWSIYFLTLLLLLLVPRIWVNKEFGDKLTGTKVIKLPNPDLPQGPIAPLNDRVLATVIDYAILVAFLLISWTLMLKQIAISFELIALGSILMLMPLYFLIEILMKGQTPGKIMRDLRIVKLNDPPSHWWHYVLRWFLLPLDLLPFRALTFLAIEGQRGRRLGDLLDRSTIIRASQHIEVQKPIASSKDRLVAMLIDLTIMLGFLLAFWPIVLTHKVVSVYWIGVLSVGLAVCFYLLSEIMISGQTPGKKFLNLNVSRLDGTAMQFRDYVMRALLLPIDFMSFGAAPLLAGEGQNGRRLGDLAAGTILVKDAPEVAKLEDDIRVAKTELETAKKPEAPRSLIQNISEASKNARSIYFIFVGLMAYCALTVFSTSDRQLILNEPVKLPIINVEVPLNGFFLLAPVLSIFIFGYLQLYLNKLKRLFDSLRLNYKPIQEGEEIYPWMLNFSQELGSGFVATTQRFIVNFSLWWSLPAVLILLASWSLKKHEPFLAVLVGLTPLIGTLVVLAFWMAYQRPASKFSLTEQSLLAMRAKGISKNVMTKLETLKQRVIHAEDGFLKVLKNTVGVEETEKYAKLIFNHSQVRSRRARLTWSQWSLATIVVLFEIYVQVTKCGGVAKSVHEPFRQLKLKG